jgi:hypothetical protein
MGKDPIQWEKTIHCPMEKDNTIQWENTRHYPMGKDPIQWEKTIHCPMEKDNTLSNGWEKTRYIILIRNGL